MKRKEAEDRSAEADMKLVGLQELVSTLKDCKGAEKARMRVLDYFPPFDRIAMSFIILISGICFLPFNTYREITRFFLKCCTLVNFLLLVYEVQSNLMPR